MAKEYIGLSKQARKLRTRFRDRGSLEELVDEVLSSDCFRANQKRNEILALLKLLRDRQPKFICEIGSERGGTLFLFSKVASPEANILSIDITHTPPKRWAFKSFVSPPQHLTCLQVNSQSIESTNQVRNSLGEHKLDFLFIDGDHSYAGVTNDYKLYLPFVRPDGVIGFHDIVPDFKTRYGIPTGNDVGQVPQFWGELKHSYPNTLEFIENSSQDGYGIGVVFLNGNPS